MLNDQKFPIFNYDLSLSPKENGCNHGKMFKTGINELATIRKNLMLQKNPGLKNNLSQLAMEQFEATKAFSPELADELEGIAEGADITIVDIVILNNYTDFRDIILPEEGCSTIQVKKQNLSISGQTWDMHRSAKNYVCLINIPGTINTPGQIYFSLVGCLGMMGISTNDLLIGVNNINTKNARASLIWPALIRGSLKSAKNYNDLEEIVTNAPVTSGHNYLLSGINTGAMWEISPDKSEMVSQIKIEDENGTIFHTNHCLGQETKKLEDPSSISTTTHDRYNVIEKNKNSINSFEELINLFHGHENYPKSICGHFEGSSQDPSSTCGGGVIDFLKNKIYFWRGCPEYDTNFISYQFIKGENSFIQVNK